MSNHHKKTIKDSEGILQESSITSQGDVQVGKREITSTRNSNNTFQIFISGGKWLILGFPIVLIFWYGRPIFDVLTNNYTSDHQAQVLDTAAVKTDLSPPLAPPSTDEALGKKNKHPITKPNPPLKEETSSRIVIGMKFTETDTPMADAIFETYNQVFKKLDIVLVKATGSISYQWELSCSFSPTIRSTELNGETFEVEGWIEATLYDMEQQSLLGSDSEQVHFFIRNKEKVPQGLKQWMENAELLEDLLPNNIL